MFLVYTNIRHFNSMEIISNFEDLWVQNNKHDYIIIC